jgi:hypothetical protein
LEWGNNGSALVVYPLSGGVITTIDDTFVDRFAGDNWGSGSRQSISEYVAVVFPVPTDLVGYTMCLDGTGLVYQVEKSTDTTDGRNGSWTVAVASPATPSGENSSTNMPYIRQDIQPLVATGVKGIRFLKVSGTTRAFGTLHFYGTPNNAGEKTLSFWHPTLDQPLGALDFEDIARSTTGTHTFRIKNSHGTLQANSVVVSRSSVHSLTGYTDYTRDYTQFSFSGGAYANSVTIGNIAAGALSGVVTVRLLPATDHPVSHAAVRLSATATTWT